MDQLQQLDHADIDRFGAALHARNDLAGAFGRRHLVVTAPGGHLGIDHRRQRLDHRDPGALQLRADRQGIGAQPRLAGAIDRRTGIGGQRQAGSDVDDHRLSPRLQHRQQPGDQLGRGVEVDVIGPLGAGQIDLTAAKVIGGADPGVVDQDVDRPFAQPGQQRLHPVRAGQVGRDHFEAVGAGRRAAFGIAARGDHGSALVAQLADQVRADPVGAAGDQHGLARKLHGILPVCYGGEA